MTTVPEEPSSPKGVPSGRPKPEPPGWWDSLQRGDLPNDPDDKTLPLSGRSSKRSRRKKESRRPSPPLRVTTAPRRGLPMALAAKVIACIVGTLVVAGLLLVISPASYTGTIETIAAIVVLVCVGILLDRGQFRRR